MHATVTMADLRWILDKLIDVTARQRAGEGASADDVARAKSAVQAEWKKEIFDSKELDLSALAVLDDKL